MDILDYAKLTRVLLCLPATCCLYGSVLAGLLQLALIFYVSKKVDLFRDSSLQTVFVLATFFDDTLDFILKVS